MTANRAVAAGWPVTLAVRLAAVLAAPVVTLTAPLRPQDRPSGRHH